MKETTPLAKKTPDKWDAASCLGCSFGLFVVLVVLAVFVTLLAGVWVLIAAVGRWGGLW